MVLLTISPQKGDKNERNEPWLSFFISFAQSKDHIHIPTTQNNRDSEHIVEILILIYCRWCWPKGTSSFSFIAPPTKTLIQRGMCVYWTTYWKYMISKDVIISSHSSSSPLCSRSRVTTLSLGLLNRIESSSTLIRRFCVSSDLFRQSVRPLLRRRHPMLYMRAS